MLTDDHRWVKATSIVDGGEVVPVFNLMVPSDHTYFVGSKRTGGFSILVHNESAAQATARKWDAEEVMGLLTALEPDIGEWLNQQQYQNGPLQRAARIAQFESSGTGIGGWWGTKVSVSSGGTPGKQPVTISAPGNWTSEQVAMFVLEQAQKDPSFSLEFQSYLTTHLKAGAVDQQVDKRADAGMKLALTIIKSYYEMLGSAAGPGGQAVMSIHDAFNGEYASAALGVLRSSLARGSPTCSIRQARSSG